MGLFSKLTNKLDELSGKMMNTAENSSSTGYERWMQRSDEEIFNEAIELSDKGLYGETLKRLLHLENRGNGDASRTLGYMYLEGDGIEEDYELATIHFRNALNSDNDSNDAATCYYIGTQYAEGKGKQQDMEKAALWYYRSATTSGACALGQISLGECYMNGWGVPQDGSEAARWYEMALGNFEEGDEFIDGVLCDLGCIYLDGIDVEPDFEKGMEYMQRAAAAGSEKAIHILRNINNY